MIREERKVSWSRPRLQSFVFEAIGNRAQQITNFITVDTRIKAIIRQKCDPYVLELIEKTTTTLPDEPTFEETTEDAKKRIAEMKFKSKFDCWLTRTEKIEKELKQIYLKYFGQCDEDMKATLAEDASFDKANKEKDVITLRKIFKV